MYKLKLRTYLMQDLEPYIDIHTMGVHYYKHQLNYLNKLNSLLNSEGYNYQYLIEELPFHINEFTNQEDIIFNLGGVLNHDLYWQSISPYKKLPSGILKELIDRKYGSFDNFYNEFKDSALKLKGSGYTFLVLDKNKNIDIVNFSNQELPILYGYIPLFTIDMWEHAYYLNYENNKLEYLDNLKNIVDFSYANEVINEIVNK